MSGLQKGYLFGAGGARHVIFLTSSFKLLMGGAPKRSALGSGLPGQDQVEEPMASRP